MAEPTPLTTTTPYSRSTLGNILDAACMQACVAKADLGTTERAVLVRWVNQELEDLRAHRAQGFGEAQQDYTWAGGGGSDPATGEATWQLPADYAEFRGFYTLGSDGTIGEPVHMLDWRDYHDSHFEGQSLYPDDPTVVGEGPVLFIDRISTGYRRIARLIPTPNDNDKFRLLYYRYAETLTNDGDTVEAPPHVMKALELGVAMRLAAGKGQIELAATLEKQYGRALGIATSPRKQEKPQPMRARFFNEPGRSGYLGTRQGYPYN